MLSKPWFVGCACDRAFVQHTAVMLTSLAENGRVPEATILIAAFDLEHEDYGILRSHAGILSDNIEFVNVDTSLLGALAGRQWDAHYPPAILGRLFLPTAIQASGARILTLDSDMVINRSVRPLFELSMDQGYLAAIHDTPREDDINYFNSGVMLIDVDEFRKYDVARRCLAWLADAAQTPRWPDQDALNVIVGDRWHRLDRTWNIAYCGGDGPLSSDFYEQASIAHFTGQGKPWSDGGHVGRGLYLRNLRAFQQRRQRYRVARAHVDDNFAATAIEFFLGREPQDAQEIFEVRAETSFGTIGRIVNSPEFVREVFLPMVLRHHWADGRFALAPNMRLRAWAKQRLPILQRNERLVLEAESWLELLQTVVFDKAFGERAGIRSMIAVSDALTSALTH